MPQQLLRHHELLLGEEFHVHVAEPGHVQPSGRSAQSDHAVTVQVERAQHTAKVPRLRRFPGFAVACRE